MPLLKSSPVHEQFQFFPQHKLSSRQSNPGFLSLTFSDHGRILAYEMSFSVIVMDGGSKMP